MHCAYFATAYGCCRATQTVLTLYVGCSVGPCSPARVARAVLWIMVGPALGMLAPARASSGRGTWRC